MHKVIKPRILYFGTPVILISTLNEDGSPNLAPMSSGWWLGWSCMLGMCTRSKTVSNLERTGECVLNLPSVDAVDRLAMLTGKERMPDYKVALGYRYEPHKFEAAQLTPVDSHEAKAPRVLECPVQMEAKVQHIHPLGAEDDHLASIEVQIIKVHIDESLLVEGHSNYINPHEWQPLIMNFCEFLGLSEQVYPSSLAEAYIPRLTGVN